MTKPIAIGSKIIGPAQPAYLIGDAGSNHDGSLDQAKALIDLAAEAGLDAVKFQMFTAEGLVVASHPAIPILKQVEFPRSWLPELLRHAQAAGIHLSASPFDFAAVDLLADAKVPFLKIASPEIHDLPLIRHAARTGLPLVISTGMADLAAIQHAVDAASEEGNRSLVLLHCVSLYPTPPEATHLRMMGSLAAAFGLPAGFSDHTESTAIPAAAVALGATVIEKHFTLDRSLPGPDHGFAMDRAQLIEMVRHIRQTESALGLDVKAPTPQEDRRINRKALVSRVAIPAGTAITADMLTVKRSPDGILPVLMEGVVGRRPAQDIAADTILTWSML